MTTTGHSVPGNEFITIVSGLPRSGTSMMMRMLEAGGMETFKDDLRQADESNPGGYYEYERTKKLKEDSSWLGEAKGKAVKIVSRLLYDLPANNQYRVVFMRRTMDEILSSQRRMLERLGKQSKDDIDDSKMAEMFRVHLEQVRQWLDRCTNMGVLDVDYNQLLVDPYGVLQHVNAFLGNKLDTERMVRVIDASLYRERR